MPISTPAVSVTGSAVRSSRRNTSTADSWVSVAFSATKRRSIRSRHASVERHHQELADADVVDQHAGLVDHVDDVQRFAVLRRARGRSRAPAAPSSLRGRRCSAASSDGRPCRARSRAASPPRARSSGVSSASRCLVTLAGSSLKNSVRSSGDMWLRSAATSSCPIALTSDRWQSGRQVLEHGGGRSAIQNAKGEDLIVSAQVAEDPGQLLRTPSLKLAAQRRKIA